MIVASTKSQLNEIILMNDFLFITKWNEAFRQEIASKYQKITVEKFERCKTFLWKKAEKWRKGEVCLEKVSNNQAKDWFPKEWNLDDEFAGFWMEMFYFQILCEIIWKLSYRIELLATIEIFVWCFFRKKFCGCTEWEQMDWMMHDVKDGAIDTMLRFLDNLSPSIEWIECVLHGWKLLETWVTLSQNFDTFTELIQLYKMWISCGISVKFRFLLGI